MKHIREVLADLMPEVVWVAGIFNSNMTKPQNNFGSLRLAALQPRCDALSSMKPKTWDQNTQATDSFNEADKCRRHNSRSVNIFYDNAQNIYGRGTPTWSELGLGMRGRATVMKESFAALADHRVGAECPVHFAGPR